MAPVLARVLLEVWFGQGTVPESDSLRETFCEYQLLALTRSRDVLLSLIVLCCC